MAKPHSVARSPSVCPEGVGQESKDEKADVGAEDDPPSNATHGAELPSVRDAEEIGAARPTQIHDLIIAMAEIKLVGLEVSTEHLALMDAPAPRAREREEAGGGGGRGERKRGGRTCPVSFDKVHLRAHIRTETHTQATAS